MLNIDNAKNYSNSIINMYKNIQYNKKEYIGFNVLPSDIHVIHEEASKALDNLKHINKAYNEYSIYEIKVFIYSYILIPLVCSDILSEQYLIDFKNNIAICNNLDKIKLFVNSIINTIQ